MENNVPNLDCMDTDELMSFWAKHQKGRAYLQIFPDGGKGTKRATADLANYASNTATGMQCRRRGTIAIAMQYENIADSIYSKLPLFARW